MKVKKFGEVNEQLSQNAQSLSKLIIEINKTGHNSTVSLSSDHSRINIIFNGYTIIDSNNNDLGVNNICLFLTGLLHGINAEKNK